MNRWVRSLVAVGRAVRRVMVSSGSHQYVLVLVDGLIGAAGLWAGMFIRFEGGLPARALQDAVQVTLLIMVARMAGSLLLRVHRWSFRFSSLVDAARVIVSAVLGSGIFVMLVFMLRVQFPPRSVVVLELLMAVVAMEAMRFTPRLTWHFVLAQTISRGEGVRRTIIVGAGAAGELLQRDLQRSDEHRYQVVGFVDDDRTKHGMVLGGKSVLGAVADLPRFATELGVVTVLIAIPRIAPERIREILSLCVGCKLNFKLLPVSFAYLSDRVAISMLQEVTPEDLLPRGEVDLESSGHLVAVRGQSALVTGAAGSIGSEICTQLVRSGVSSLVMVDINENEMYMLKLRLQAMVPQAHIEAEVADIRDEGRILSLFERYRPQSVFHAAAHKHVPLMEAAPCEAVKNNIFGTRNVAEAAHRYGAERMVYISTDKAVRPTSVMGASKRVGELIVRKIAQRSTTNYSAVRFGNVLGSAGSVTLIFREQIAGRRPVTVTHPDVKRYFMTTKEAVSLVLRAAFGGKGGLFVLEMGEQIRIHDLARHMITMAGLIPNVDIPIVFTGLRPGEKLFEELMTDAEEKTVQVDRKIFVVDSPDVPAGLEQWLDRLQVAASAERSSAVIELLRGLIKSYTPTAASRPDAKAGEEDLGGAPAGTSVRVH